jgi:hypothetical protein
VKETGTDRLAPLGNGRERGSECEDASVADRLAWLGWTGLLGPNSIFFLFSEF